MPLTDPLAWKDDLTFYMTADEVGDTVAAQEPLLVQGGAKVATGAFVGLAGLVGGAFGGLTVSPSIRQPIAFVAYLVFSAVLLRGLYPLTVRLLGEGAGWLTMFAFVWASFLGVIVVLAAGFDSRWVAYGSAAGAGAFIGMMYGAFPPDTTRNQDAWMLAFVVAPLATVVATLVLRRTGALETIGGAAGAGALAGALLMGVMGALMVRLWDEAQGFAELGQLYLHNDAFAPRAAACFDRAIEMRPGVARYYNLRAVAFAQMNDAERASADWDQASSLAPGDPEPDVQRGADRLRRGATGEAVRWLESALAKNAGHARAHGWLAAALERNGERERAFAHYDRAVSLARDDAWVHCARSAAYVRQGDYAGALKDAERAVRLQSHRGLAYAARGDALRMLGRSDEALGSYQEALDLGVEPAVHEDVLRHIEALHAAGAPEEHE